MTPWPNAAPADACTDPCSTMLVAVGVSPDVVRTSDSCARLAPPVARSCAPPVCAPLSQPRPRPPGGLPQGQGSTPDRPGSQVTPCQQPEAIPQRAMWFATRPPAIV